MNKFFKLLSATQLLLFSANAQVLLEHTYSAINFAQPIVFSTNGEKIMTFDSARVYLYNMDHSLWKTITPTHYTSYRIAYVYGVSDNLFNSDNSIELVVGYFSITAFPRYKSEVVNEVSAIIQSLDSSYSGSIHYNQENNSYKLFTNMINVGPYYVTNVYSVPGTMPCGKCGTMGVERAANLSSIHLSDAYPNPSSGMARIEYELPYGELAGELLIYNQSGQLIKSLLLNIQSHFTDVNNSGFPAGIYSYQVRSGVYYSETKSMIVKP